MSDTLWRRRPEAFRDAGNPTGLFSTPRDMAKLGQLVLDKGVADGKRVISETQLSALFQRSPTNPAYGRLWWLNGSRYALRPAGVRTETALIPAAPAELVAALGAQDRKIYVVPSCKLVVVRIGQAAPDRDFDQQVWVRLMKALPKRTNRGSPQIPVCRLLKVSQRSDSAVVIKRQQLHHLNTANMHDRIDPEFGVEETCPTHASRTAKVRVAGIRRGYLSLTATNALSLTSRKRMTFGGTTSSRRRRRSGKAPSRSPRNSTRKSSTIRFP